MVEHCTELPSFWLFAPLNLPRHHKLCPATSSYPVYFHVIISCAPPRHQKLRSGSLLTGRRHCRWRSHYQPRMTNSVSHAASQAWIFNFLDRVTKPLNIAQHLECQRIDFHCISFHTWPAWFILVTSATDPGRTTSALGPVAKQSLFLQGGGPSEPRSHCEYQVLHPHRHSPCFKCWWIDPSLGRELKKDNPLEL